MTIQSILLSLILCIINTGASDINDNTTETDDNNVSHVPVPPGINQFESIIWLVIHLSLTSDYKDGGLPLISDSVFSLIIMLYVLFAFLFVFFLFCWRRGPDMSFGKVTQLNQSNQDHHPHWNWLCIIGYFFRKETLNVFCRERQFQLHQLSLRPLLLETMKTSLSLKRNNLNSNWMT